MCRTIPIIHQYWGSTYPHMMLVVLPGSRTTHHFLPIVCAIQVALHGKHYQRSLPRVCLYGLPIKRRRTRLQHCVNTPGGFGARPNWSNIQLLGTSKARLMPRYLEMLRHHVQEPFGKSAAVRCGLSMLPSTSTVMQTSTCYGLSAFVFFETQLSPCSVRRSLFLVGGIRSDIIPPILGDWPCNISKLAELHHKRLQVVTTCDVQPRWLLCHHIKFPHLHFFILIPSACEGCNR